ncbi:Telomere length regulation protein, conserved domain protein [Kalmanozyma brasiliensis GHG001]|nr:Telomere length regulation protein, conserved domain protein [Kalmanozyma brasiliensis GHG001]EST05586.2 Telomere length regulation protein, conserved domain protein [Kalmanozyma brasiliensis GHG001]
MSAGPSHTVDSRQLRRDFAAIKDGTKRFGSPSEVIATFTAPFIRLFGPDALPPSLRPAIGPSASTSAPQRAPLDVLLIETIQEALLVRIVIDLPSSTQLRDLLELWSFAPSLQAAQKGAVQQCALRTLCRVLPSPNLHPLTLAALERLCIEALDRLSLPALVSSVQAEPNAARADVAWSETLRLACSLPDRLANATQGKLPAGFSQTTWIGRVLVGGIAQCLSTAKEGERVPTKHLKDVLTRLDRMGYLSRAVDAEGRGFWVTLLRRIQGDEGAARNCARLRSRLGRSLRGRLDCGLVETLQYWMTRKGVASVLVTSAEKARPGTEGTAFLGKSSQEMVAALTHIFDTLLRPSSSDYSTTSASDSDDDDDAESRLIADFRLLALSSPHHSPLLAWAWAHHLAHTLPPASLLICLESSLEQWSDPSRIRLALLTPTLFLSTLIACLLAAIPSTLPGLAAVARSSAVITGVSSHLEQPDPTIRRMGMLIAELLSAKTAGEGKALNFGKGAWNGTGEGREEARVVRALGDAWSHHVKCVDRVREGWKGVGEAVRVVGVEEEERMVERIESISKEKRGKVRTRRLPERVAPVRPAVGAKTRPLITMIEPDNEQELPPQESPLTMFSSRPTRASDASDSSSEGSDSDIAPDDPESVHRLAASLTGLSTSETNTLLNTNPRSGGKITDLDANTDAHAPSFTRTPPPPIYISQLSPLLRASDRSSIRQGLHHASSLIARKSNPAFGAEVRENAVDLVLTLIALHDNYGIKRFEQMRRAAVKALAIAEPGVVVPVLVEQGMGGQYSEAQRRGVWWAVVESAVVLAKGDAAGDGDEEEGGRVERVMEGVVKGARAVGESKVPQIKRQRGLMVSQQTSAGRGKMVQLHDPSAPSALVTGGKDEWAQLAGPVYLFPLINRFLAYQAYAQRGAGGFDTTTTALFHDTISVLLSLAPTTLIPSVTTSVLDLLSTSLSPTLTPTGPLTNSLLTLLAITLDRTLQGDPQRLLQDRHSVSHLQQLMSWTREVFADVQAQAPTGMAGKIAARAASVLLLMDRLDEVREGWVRELVGFVPA